MTYEEFEWHILRLVYEEGVDRLQPSFLAYALGMPHEKVVAYLEQALNAQLLEVEVTEEGRLEYRIPGVEREAIPKPIWREGEAPEAAKPAKKDEAPARVDEAAASREALVAVVESAPDGADGADGADGGIVALRADGADGADGTDGMDGMGGMDGDAGLSADGTDGHLTGSTGQGTVVPLYKKRPELPPTLRSYIRDNYGDTDGHVSFSGPGATAVAIVEREARPEPQAPPRAAASTALVPRRAADHALLRVEASEDAFCDPSQTIFMRQIRVHGVASEAILREQVQRLFESFGYKAVTVSPDRLRFERGSVTFILALVPLFVLILPLFVYLFLYCMGRSTIQQEPLELDVQIRRHQGSEDSYDIDLTFIGLHGVVLGAADQRVLNQEIDTLRDELRWALTGS